MGRSESAPDAGERGDRVRVKAVSGSHAVLLVWDLPSASARQGLLGFAIRKSSGGRQRWLPSGGRRFASSVGGPGDPEAAAEAPVDGVASGTAGTLSDDKAAGAAPKDAGRVLTTREAPIQAFSWCDYTCCPGDRCSYLVCPVYAGAGAERPRIEEGAGVEVAVRLEANDPDRRHEVWFNRGVAGSQAYSRRFGSARPGDPEAKPEVWPWLSHGLDEALLAFIGRAEGPGWSLRGAFYEFTWQPALEAFAKASERGADVALVVDCGPAAPRADAQPPAGEQASTGCRVDLCVPYKDKDQAKQLGARWDPIRKVWYAPAGQPALLAKWGQALADTPQPLKADLAIDAVPGLRKLVVRRERSKGIQHNKFLVLSPPEGTGEAAAVWTGGLNLTESGIYGQANFAHVVNGNSGLVEEYLAYWEQLASDSATEALAAWNAARLADKALPLDPAAGDEDSETVEHAVTRAPKATERVVMCPRPSLGLLTSYGRLLASARRCACITAAFGVERSLAKVLAEESDAARYVLLERRGATYDTFAGRPGVHVACGALLGKSERLDGLDEEAQGWWMQEQLTGLNEHVLFVHTKLMLIDPLGSSPTVVCGSANFSQSSVLKNDENMLFIKGDTRVADLYFVEFWRLFQHWRFRDQVASVAWERSTARRAGRERPTALSLHLAEDDSWVAPYYEPASARCREREMLLSLHVPKAGPAAPGLDAEPPLPDLSTLRLE